MAHIENDIRDELYKYLMDKPHIILCRNNVGFDFDKKIHYGLRKGSGDLIGWKTIKITEDMIGKEIAVFLSVELKKDSKQKPTPEQLRWKENVNKAGGIALVIGDRNDFNGI